MYPDYSPTKKWFLSHTHDLHKKRLKLIKREKSGRIDNKYPESLKLLPKFNQETKEMLAQRHKSIQLENFFILHRLSAISSSQSGKYPESVKIGPASLNSVARKRETTKIETENEHFVKRLNLVRPSLPIKNYLKSYKRGKTTASKRFWTYKNRPYT